MLRSVVSVVIYIVGFTYGWVIGFTYGWVTGAIAELKEMRKNRS